MLIEPRKYNLSTIEPNLSSYSEIIAFIKNFDSKLKISKSSILKLKNRKIIFKSVPRTKETISFVSYIKKIYPNFDDGDFLKSSKS